MYFQSDGPVNIMVNFWEDVTKMLRDEFQRAADSKLNFVIEIDKIFS